MRGIALISGILFIAITLSAIAIAYNLAVPIVGRMQSTAAFERMKVVMGEMDSFIQEVASEGNGSRRIFNFRIAQGNMLVDPERDAIFWALDMDALVVSPRTALVLGNLVIGSNLETTAQEGLYSGIPAFMLENEHLRIYFRKIGSPQYPESYNTSQILLALYQKDLSQWLDLESMYITIDGNPSSELGVGYTELDKTGYYLPYGTVRAYMDSTYSDYVIEFTLESGADFLEIRGELL